MKFNTVKINDLRPYDFDSGKRLAIPPEKCEKCECCGKKIAKVHELENGNRVGQECAEDLYHIEFKFVGGESADSLVNFWGYPKKAVGFVSRSY